MVSEAERKVVGCEPFGEKIAKCGMPARRGNAVRVRRVKTHERGSVDCASIKVEPRMIVFEWDGRFLFAR